MGLFIFFQLLVNMALISAMGWLFWKRRDLFTQPATDEQVIQKWKQEWELEKQNYEQQLALQLRSMKLLYEQTKKLLEEKQASLYSVVPSQEETEIKAVLQDKPHLNIPTLTEFEVQKTRLKQEVPLDLKSILSEQLC